MLSDREIAVAAGKKLTVVGEQSELDLNRCDQAGSTRFRQSFDAADLRAGLAAVDCRPFCCRTGNNGSEVFKRKVDHNFIFLRYAGVITLARALSDRCNCLKCLERYQNFLNDRRAATLSRIHASGMCRLLSEFINFSEVSHGSTTCMA